MPTTSKEVLELEVATLVAHPDNPRAAHGDLTELAASIKEVGVLEPVLVVPENGHFEIVAGHRRVVASELAGLATVPAIVREDWAGDLQTARVAMLVENLHRENLTILDESRGFAKLQEAGLSQREIAKKVGCDQSHVSRALAVGKLPEKAKGWVATGDISHADAVVIAQLPKKDTDELLDFDSAPSTQQIEWAKRTQEHEREKQAAIKELQAGPYAFVESAVGTATKGPTTLKTLQAYGREGVGLTAHQKLDCHAVTLDHNNLVRGVCTKPRSHKLKTAPAKKSTDPKAAKREEVQALNAELRGVNEERWRWITTKAKPTHKQCLELSVRHILLTEWDLSSPEAEIAEAFGTQVKDNLLGLIKSDEQRVRFLFLVGCRQREYEFNPGHSTWGEPKFGCDEDRDRQNLCAYLNDLEALGYVPSAIERRYVGLAYEDEPTTDPGARVGT